MMLVCEVYRVANNIATLLSDANLKTPLADAFLKSLHVDPSNNNSNNASRCILVPFEWYGHQKKCTQKGSCKTFFIYISCKN